ncbi:hypothetical protein [Sphingobium sp. LSP13-1-1.1]
MIRPDDHDRREQEARERGERGMLGLVAAFVLLMIYRVGLAWAEGRL